MQLNRIDGVMSRQCIKVKCKKVTKVTETPKKRCCYSFCIHLKKHEHPWVG